MKRRYIFSSSSTGGHRGFIEFEGKPDAGEFTSEGAAAPELILWRRKMVHTPHGAMSGMSPEGVSVFWLDIIADEIARARDWELEATGDSLPTDVDPPADVLRLAQ